MSPGFQSSPLATTDSPSEVFFVIAISLGKACTKVAADVLNALLASNHLSVGLESVYGWLLQYGMVRAHRGVIYVRIIFCDREFVAVDRQ